MTSRPPFTYDPTVDAAYISISDQPHARTREITTQIIVDLDADDRVIGVEIIGLYRLMEQVAPEALP